MPITLGCFNKTRKLPLIIDSQDEKKKKHKIINSSILPKPSLYNAPQTPTFSSCFIGNSMFKTFGRKFLPSGSWIFSFWTLAGSLDSLLPSLLPSQAFHYWAVLTIPDFILVLKLVPSCLTLQPYRMRLNEPLEFLIFQIILIFPA